LNWWRFFFIFYFHPRSLLLFHFLMWTTKTLKMIYLWH
jgi:hypothetical protein